MDSIESSERVSLKNRINITVQFFVDLYSDKAEPIFMKIIHDLSDYLIFNGGFSFFSIKSSHGFSKSDG